LHAFQSKAGVWRDDCNKRLRSQKQKFLEETKMAKSAKKGKLTSKKLEKKAPLTGLRHS
jgi:hypothetical protein